MRYQLLGAIAALALAGSAQATVYFTFGPGSGSPDSGYTVINTFDDLTGVTVNSAPGTVFVQTANNSNGAPPANSNPLGTSYLSVKGRGSATINFGPTSAFQFDWGSIDTYNTLTIYTNFGYGVVIPGTNFTNDADGNQVNPGTNGLFTVYSDDPSEYFTGIMLESSTNSFEIDNLAIKSGAVPEPATWAMLIAGFGLVGVAMRRRSMTPVRVSA